jgi:dTDP-4-dehydrorhamnose reductase
MRLQLLGGTGQVGEELRTLALARQAKVFAPSRAELELEDPRAIARMVGAERWSAVINAAAYTDVDRAESEQPIAFAINAEAPGRLAEETASRGIPLVHISTDYVFDGRKGTPYVETDEPRPLNAYGRSKLAGERAVRVTNPRHVIVRTAWVYSPYRKNFVRTILRLATERERLTVVADQRGCPTAARDVAQTCLDFATRCATDPDAGPYGTYHFAGAGAATWFDFAAAIVDLAGHRLGRKPQLVPIATSDYPTAAARAADTRLDCAAIVAAFGLEPRPWRQALAETIDRLATMKG